MGGGRQNQRSAETEVSEHQLSEVCINPFAVLEHRQSHVSQAETLEGPPHPKVPQGHQGAPEGRYRVPGLRRHAVALAGRAGGGIGHAAGG